MTTATHSTAADREKSADYVSNSEATAVMGLGIGSIGAVISAIGAYLLWGAGGALLTGGSAIVVLSAMFIVRPIEKERPPKTS